MTAQEIITTSMRKLGAVASGETPTPEELQDGLSALQSMLRAWAGKRILVFATSKDTLTLSPPIYQYTWGTGGTFNSARPNKILGAYILDSEGTSHPIDIITENKYRDISVKGTVSRPYALYPNMTYPLITISFYPVPDTAEVVYLDSLKPFTEASSFAVLSDELAFPPSYEEAIIYNLAIRLAPEIGKTVTPEVVVIASNGYDSIVNENTANAVEPARISIPYTWYRPRYSINSDTYH